MNCGTTINVAGPCSVCGDPLDVCHIITDHGSIANVRLTCGECCPIHRPIVEKVWDGEAVTVSGKQETLF